MKNDIINKKLSILPKKHIDEMAKVATNDNATNKLEIIFIEFKTSIQYKTHSILIFLYPY